MILCRGYSLEVPLYKNVGIRSVSDLFLSTLKGKKIVPRGRNFKRKEFVPRGRHFQ